MTIEGANIFFDATDYTIYTMNSTTTGQYCVVLPKNTNGTYNMLVDLHMKNAFDSVSNGSKTKEQLVEEIKNEYMGVKTKYNDGILVIPMIDENLYSSAVVNNDKQKMFDKVKKIGAITSEIYKKLTDSGIDKQKIDQKIIMIIKNNDDIKFVDWLKEQMPNFVIGVNLSELQATNNNPFMANSNPFVAEQPAPVTNDIFGAPSAPVNNSVNNDIFNVTPPVSNPTPTNDIFSNPTSTEAATNDIFSTPATSNNEVVEPTPVETVKEEQPVQAPTNVNPVPTTESVATPEQPTVTNNQTTEAVEPAPVQSTPLEATTTITPIQPTEVGNNGEVVDTNNVPEKKGSKGFTNLLILLVVLSIVTFVSIELGKFLYNTYGV